MGQATSEIALSSPADPTVPAIAVDALVATGAMHLCIPEHLQTQLKLREIGRKEVTLADGSRKVAPDFGPVDIRFRSRVGFAGALVLGNQVLRGVIQMEDLDPVVVPRTRTLDVNPDSPNVATTLAKLRSCAPPARPVAYRARTPPAQGPCPRIHHLCPTHARSRPGTTQGLTP